MKKTLIIGSGISGIVCARILAENGYEVSILEKRDHIGGNIFDYYEDGVLVHKYGPHLFHTNIDDVAKFVCRFSKFIEYEHRVLGEIDNKLVPIPFNFKSIDLLFGEKEAQHLKDVLAKKYSNGESVSILELRKSDDKEVRELAEYVFKNVFLGYTMKQWGKEPKDIDESVMARVPVRMSYDDRYFTDRFQKMPEDGYTVMLNNMVNHPNISIKLNCDALEHIQIDGNKIRYDGEFVDYPVIYTGCIEELFGNKFGQLPYRSLHFELEKKNVKQFQPTVQINYPNRYSYTRTSEFKLVQYKDNPEHTIVMYEYPKACGKSDIPYYPIESEESRKLYNEYLDLSKKISNLYLTGRLAEYKYYNMDLSIKHAMDLVNTIIGNY